MALERRLEKEAADGAADALAYAAIDRRREAAALAALAGRLGFRGGPAADLGAGPGHFAEALCRRFSRARVTAVDLSPEMLTLAEARLRAARLSRRVRLICADAAATGLPAGAFSLVACCNAAHHLPRPGRLFREAARLCRPGGVILFRDLRRPRSAAALRGLLALAAGDAPRQLALLEASYRAALTPEEARSAAARAGLEDFTVEEDGARHWRLYRAARRG